MSGILTGLTRREVLDRLDAIIAFAELEKFIDHPLRTYSTGMQMRLAFSAAVHAEPEVLIIDEVLSVGDIAFQRKCLDRIAQFRKAGCSILLVSHEASVVQDLCDDVLWVNAGRLMAQGPASEVLRQYAAHMGVAPEPAAGVPVAPVSSPSMPPTILTEQGARVTLDESRFGSEELRIRAVRALDSLGQQVTALPSGSPLRIEIDYHATRRVVGPLFRVRILREDGLVCCDFSTARSALSLSAVEGPGRLVLSLNRLDLSGGRYVIDVGCYSQDGAYTYDFHATACPLTIQGGSASEAIFNAPSTWEFNGEAVAQREQGTLSAHSQ
jgi:lipopolysaccharide transport system ATP-binding protein